MDAAVELVGDRERVVEIKRGQGGRDEAVVGVVREGLGGHRGGLLVDIAAAIRPAASCLNYLIPTGGTAASAALVLRPRAGISKAATGNAPVRTGSGGGTRSSPQNPRKKRTALVIREIILRTADTQHPPSRFYQAENKPKPKCVTLC